jgi:uncharacterized delta-60 repeat protein
MAIQPDGRIVLAGTAARFGVFFGLARYNSDASLDPTFGTGGKVTSNLGHAQAFGTAIQGDGKIVAAGVIWTPSRPNFGLARYETDGSLDPTFGTDGSVITAFDPDGAQAQAVAIQGDGKIVAAGAASGPSGSDFALARYTVCPLITTTSSIPCR